MTRSGGVCVLAAAALAAFAVPAHAAPDLARADVSHLANGLTVILLEDHSFPVVSVQALYKSGSADETAGKTGLAHFLEHLAFRGSKDFPNAAATEAIYDAGGEWHGYTWLDQTTYFETAPKENLDLLLRIEADRMANVEIDPAAIAAEKGAVITEMHGYENDPASVLLDAVTATAIQAHPYRNNTIGYETDVEALTADDARAYYAAHYAPANAVLALVGDFRLQDAKALMAKRFANVAPRSVAPPIRTVEPVQRGERRTLLHGAVDRQHFLVAYPAPAASSPDFAAFLVLQQLIGGGSGVNFRENDWGAAAVRGSLLFGLTDDLTTWFIPTRDRYLFTIGGSIDAAASQGTLERELDRRLAAFQPTRLAEAKAAVLEELAADVQTTEDAAHQLAFFEGIGALDTLFGLRKQVEAVSEADLARIVGTYLDPRQRTFGWLVSGDVPASALGKGTPRPAAEQRGIGAASPTRSEPQLFTLSSGLPVAFAENRSTDRVAVELVVSAPLSGDDGSSDLAGLGVITRTGPGSRLVQLIADAHAELAKQLLSDRHAVALQSDDPDTRFHQLAAEIMRPRPSRAVRPIMIAVSGAVDQASLKGVLENQFAGLEPAALGHATAETPGRRSLDSRRVAIDKPLSQGALGYVVAAPAPGTHDGVAWRLLRYILIHDYSGRLGRSAIMDKGLVYYIANAYATDGAGAWIKIWAGVDPARADAFDQEFRDQLAMLATHPPTAAEVEAAKRNLLGRDISAAQNNLEIAHKLARQFVETGRLQSHAELEQLVNSISAADIAKAVPAFSAGTILRVDVKR